MTIDDCRVLPIDDVDARFAIHARAWGVAVDETRSTETSTLGFGRRGRDRVVLKVIRQENGGEWHGGAILE